MRVIPVPVAVLLGALLLVFPAASTVAASPGTSGVTRSGYQPVQLAPQDEEYLQRSHQANLTEITAGNLAQHKGTCAEVRELGMRFAVHHTELDVQVIAVAMRHGVFLPQTPSPEQTAALIDLTVRSGRDFDISWLHFQIVIHEQALELTEQELQHGVAHDVKELAAMSAPIIERHLAEARAELATCR